MKKTTRDPTPGHLSIIPTIDRISSKAPGHHQQERDPDDLICTEGIRIVSHPQKHTNRVFFFLHKWKMRHEQSLTNYYHLKMKTRNTSVECSNLQINDNCLYHFYSFTALTCLLTQLPLPIK